MANSSYYSSGKSGSPPPARSFEPVVDKNPIYRTNDTFKRAYKKDIKVLDGDVNQTDCTSTIWVKFSDPINQKIIEDLGVHGTRQRFLLECGHTWEGRRTTTGDSLPCMVCGGEQGYLGFEHEWQHILFETDPQMARLFITPWAEELRRHAPHVDQTQLERFLFFVLNAFDDIRCNSLWERIYPGSADRIWKRWTRLSSSRSAEDNSENFIGFLFAVALGTPTLPDGPFEELRPFVAWGMDTVKYKGYRRAMMVARMAMDRCLSQLLSDLYPPPSQSPTQGQGAPDAGMQVGQGQDGDSGDSAGQGVPVPSGDAEAGHLGSVPAPGGDDSPDPLQVSAALGSVIRKSHQFDPNETHQLPDKPTPGTPVSASAAATVASIMQEDPEDPQLEADIDSGTGSIDPDMQDVIDQFSDGVSQISSDSQLTADAKARVVFIDVMPENIDPHSQIQLNTKEQEAVLRMQSVFFRTLGRQKAHRENAGSSIDVDAAIQYMIDQTHPEVFEQDQNNQGFAYMQLCDMSGSMAGTRFQQVCHATEMLKQSLHFPFVEGALWGFRGGDRSESEVWIYRYDKNCKGYLGRARAVNRATKALFPVECNGLTPMHSAVRVATRHLLTQVSPGMAKRLFLLTDGSPVSVKGDGKGLPYWVLQQYVAKEIQWARQRGVQVYTLVIGGALEEKECRLMFGAPKYWRVVTDDNSENSVDRVLQHLVIQNFERYLKTRG
jgi:hypothetical protein